MSHLLTRKVCPVCKGSDSILRYRCAFDSSPLRDYLISFYSPQGTIEMELLADAEYVLLECKGCGLIFQRDVPDDELSYRLYEVWLDPQRILEFHRHNDDLNLFGYFAQEVATVIAYFGKAPAELRFLDFGMGWGQWALMARAFGCKSAGAELSPSRLEYASANGIDVLDWDQIPGAGFDFINTEQVFEHIAEPVEVLLHLKRGLGEGGIIKISVPPSKGIEQKLAAMDWSADKDSPDSLNVVAPLEHLNCFRRPTLERMARDAGMIIVTMPLRNQIAYAMNWSDPRKIARNLLRPLLRNFTDRENYVFLTPMSM